MARFTRESVDRVKEAVDIVEIVSAHTDLQQRGQDFWGNCPFQISFEYSTYTRRPEESEPCTRAAKWLT